MQLDASHGRFRLPWRTLLLALSATLLYWIAGIAPDNLVYSREAIEQGELWSLISGHWVHSDRQHAVWNIAALLILGSLFERTLRHRLFTDLLLASLLLSLWIGILMPELQAYCGLSGILNTLLVSGCLALWQQLRSPTLLLIPALAFFKSLFELYHHQAIFTQTAWPSVPEAHLVGMAIGLLLFFLRSNLERDNKTKRLFFQGTDNR
jgi:rhomboid family GlyGly-CTERM serine protease